MKQLFSILVAIAMVNNISVSFAQNLVSPQVHEDGSVTFRLRAPKAQQVDVTVGGQKLALAKSGNGIWEGSSKPLSPQIYDYTFNVDGTMMIDPSNRMVKKWLTMASMVEIPGNPPLITEVQKVPHGEIHRISYPSSVSPADRTAMVYTPPGYASSEGRVYPLLILMHGYGDDETAWTEVGRAHAIADNLIATSQIEPVVIVMPYGHPEPLNLQERPDNYFIRNNELYERDVTECLLPFLEARYRIETNADRRAIAGLSMGGGHAIDIGLKNPQMFSSVAAFSAAVPQKNDQDLLAEYPSLGGTPPAANSFKSFWIPIGKDDFLLKGNEAFDAQLTKLGVVHQYELTDGGHDWKVWRDYLPKFLTMAFPKEK
ncbi:MAG: hypothetical protein JNL58_00205 [Planctomyces sp.]|nr:hypothetical protein [Planctomyces sp.]